MDPTMLYIFVEGNDDERFFEEILVPRLKKKYAEIKIVKYAQKPKKFEYLQKFIKSIQAMKGNYIFVGDIDNFPCITAKKQKIKSQIKVIDIHKIIVVIKEIESWYLAGVDADVAKRLRIEKVPNTTDEVTKEEFRHLMPKSFDSYVDFMIEILKNFSLETALTKNKSFRYCVTRLDC